MKNFFCPSKIWFEPICFQVLWQFGIFTPESFLPAHYEPRFAWRGQNSVRAIFRIHRHFSSEKWRRE